MDSLVALTFNGVTDKKSPVEFWFIKTATSEFMRKKGGFIKTKWS